ncbi:quinoprotein dehydrogenase-associated putative ABC transporter substrate-binding protein [Thiolinea disciformis]|uniref:quinoprotein dehydrogenase-associated putative ABC transporter substrate-binding protein n=1 Tax=Thiolinea disciformis TaxID=125614 RepID=UPI00036EC55A|nr:quinoprotein dehydrogenase-associated putative ABC transporter substrate-binding protein [Thiolinea disciformis]
MKTHNRVIRRAFQVTALAVAAITLSTSSSLLAAEAMSARTSLKVCADPHYMPFSSQQLDGYENKLADLMGRALGVPVQYTWFPQRIGFIRNTLRKETPQGQVDGYLCDVVMGVPAGYEQTLTSKPYMQSSYMLVVNPKGKLAQLNTAQPLLNQIPEGSKIGVTERSPGAEWLAKHNLFLAMQSYVAQSGDPNEYPGQLILQDLLAGHLDAAIVWGPTAAYFVKQSPTDARFYLVAMPKEQGIQFHYSIATGVRFGDKAWRDQINNILAQHQEQIKNILTEYGIPLVNAVGEVLLANTPTANAAEATPPATNVAPPSTVLEMVTTQPPQPVLATPATQSNPSAPAQGMAAPVADPAPPAPSVTTTPVNAATPPTPPIPPTPPTPPAVAAPAAGMTGETVVVSAAKPYEGHLQCDTDGKNCKVDTYIIKGFRTFGQCQVCHGIDGSGSTIAPNLLEKLQQLDKATFINRVTEGYKGQIGVMPPWKENPNVMNNIENLYAYLKARSDGLVGAGSPQRF